MNVDIDFSNFKKSFHFTLLFPPNSKFSSESALMDAYSDQALLCHDEPIFA